MLRHIRLRELKHIRQKRNDEVVMKRMPRGHGVSVRQLYNAFCVT